MKLTDNDQMMFGKYRGKVLMDVPAQYLLWVLDQQWARIEHPDLINYIRDNKDILESEIHDDHASPVGFD